MSCKRLNGSLSRYESIGEGVKKELMDELPTGYLIYRALLSHCKSVGLIP